MLINNSILFISWTQCVNGIPLRNNYWSPHTHNAYCCSICHPNKYKTSPNIRSMFWLLYPLNEIMKFVLFADDTNILCKHENYVSLCELVNIELSELSKWFSINKLSLNVKKTSYMLFGNRQVNNDIKNRIDMEEIEKVQSSCYQIFRGLHRLSIRLEETHSSYYRWRFPGGAFKANTHVKHRKTMM